VLILRQGLKQTPESPLGVNKNEKLP
jgi:hypothetical protein